MDLAHGVNQTASPEVTKVKTEMTVITLENVIVHFSVRLQHLNSTMTIFKIYLSRDPLMTWQQSGTMIRATFKMKIKTSRIAVSMQ